MGLKDLLYPPSSVDYDLHSRYIVIIFVSKELVKDAP